MRSIVYVFQDRYPWDVRAEKFTRSLTTSGYKTTILARNREGEPLRDTMPDGTTVRRLRPGSGTLSRTILNFPAFFSPFWLSAIRATVKEENADLIIVRDLPLAPTAYWAGRLAGIPVMMDMAEDYPAMIEDTWRFRGRGPFDILLRNPKLLRALEAWIVRKMDGISVVSDESADRVRKLVSGSGTQVWVIGNTPLLRRSNTPKTCDLARRLRSMQCLKLLYVGGLEETRGLDVVIRALKLVQDRIGGAKLVVVGEGTGAQRYKAEAQSAGLTGSVLFTGWQDPEHIQEIIGAADVCLIPHYVTPHTDTTLPNKLYDYMLAGKPVIATNSQSLRAMIDRNQCGLLYNDRRHEDLANAVVKLTDSALRDRLGSNGRRAVTETYNWSADEAILLASVNELITRTDDKL